MARSVKLMLTTVFRRQSDFIPGVLWPSLVGFVSISLFLFLSYMIIEGYSIVQMVRKDREVTIIEVLEEKP